ncbi:MAG: DUF4440 domain-containing protein [Cellulosilyticaceae bacterium]
MCDDIEVGELILTLEERLLNPEVRCSKQKLEELLDEEFIEFCTSGNIYIYDKDKVIDTQTNLEVVNWRILDFKIKWISKECILATYRLVKDSSAIKEYSLRSSIWKKQNNRWKMIFHQGTKMNE